MLVVSALIFSCPLVTFWDRDGENDGWMVGRTDGRKLLGRSVMFVVCPNAVLVAIRKVFLVLNDERERHTAELPLVYNVLK